MKIEEWRISHHTHCNRQCNECEHYHSGFTMGVDLEDNEDGRTGEDTTTTRQGDRGYAQETGGTRRGTEEDTEG